MIIVAGVPGIGSQRDLLVALTACSDSGIPASAHGGFVVDETTAHRFLSIYLGVAPPSDAGDGIPRVATWEVAP